MFYEFLRKSLAINIYALSQIPMARNPNAIHPLKDHCAVATIPFPMIQPAAQRAPNPISVLPMTERIKTDLFILTIANSLLKNVVKKEPMIIPSTNKLPQPRPWPPGAQPPERSIFAPQAFAQVKIGVDIAKPVFAPVRL